MQRCNEFYGLHYLECFIMFLIKLNINIKLGHTERLFLGAMDNNLVSYHMGPV